MTLPDNALPFAGANDDVPEPAMALTIQTTVPVLMTLLFSFSLAMIGYIATRENWPSTQFWLASVRSKDVALWLLSAAAFLFLSAVISCVKAHAWDYYALSKERRDEELLLPKAPAYINKCSVFFWAWYKVAILNYYVGLVFLLFGIACLFWKISAPTVILALATLGLMGALKLMDILISEKTSRREWRIKKLKKFTDKESLDCSSFE